MKHYHNRTHYKASVSLLSNEKPLENFNLKDPRISALC